MPGSGGVARRAPDDAKAASELRSRVALAAFAALLLIVWLAAGPRTPDLAAATYRVELFRHFGFLLVDERWYGGHDLPGYSLLFPPLGSLLGVRVAGALAVLCSCVLFERLLRPRYGRAAVWGGALFTLAAVGDVWSGRVAFALGVPFALGALLSMRGGHDVAAALLAAASAAASPVAGALLGLAALTLAALERRWRPLVVLAAPAAFVVVALALLFPEGGHEPFPLWSFLACAGVVVLFLVAVPRGGADTRALRMGGAIYLAVCVACLLVRTPVGSNVERYGVLLAGPLLLCALVASREGRGGNVASREGRGWSVDSREGRGWSVARPAALVGAMALLAACVWIVWGPVRETLAVAGSKATSAAYYAPLEHFLARADGGPVRVEVPLTGSHWEAALLAPDVSLARGWEKQLEERYDGVLLSGGLTAASYERWLHEQAVGYVALPDVALDPSSAAEGRLIRAGLPYLREVFRSEHWRVFRVAGAVPLASGPGRLTGLGHDWFSLRAIGAGSFVVRVHYTRYWTFAAGSGCVTSAPGGWTRVQVPAAGRYVIAARFSVERALGWAGSCSGGAHTVTVRLRDAAWVWPQLETGPTGVVGGRLAGAAAASARDDGAAAVAGTLPSLSSGVGRLPLYRWMVRTEGALPSIARENTAAGTSAWRLPGPSELLGGEARGAIAGYVSEQSILPGEVERVYVGAPRARSVRIEVFRMGWYGGKGGRLVLRSRALPVHAQPPCAHDFSTGLTQCDWSATLDFAIPRALASGVYIVQMRASTGAESDCMFVLRPSRPPQLLVEIPTASYEAYNAWGGDSLYPGGSDAVAATGSDQGVEVSYDRPYATQTGAGEFFIREVAAVRFLERYGYPVGYTTIDSLDREPGQLDGVRAFIDVGHSEYWSSRDQQALARALAHGTSLIFMSSDTMAWRVRFATATAASSEVGQADHRIVAYKEYAAADPDRADVTGLFPLGGAQLTGSAYDGCITPRVPRPGPPVYRYYAWRPAPALSPAWLFAGSGVSASTSIAGIVGYELDERTSASPPGTVVVGSGTGVPCGSEDEPSPVHGTIAQSTFYTAPSGAFVFASGTLGWLYALSPVPQASSDAPQAPDPRVVAMTRNLLGKALHLRERNG